MSAVAIKDVIVNGVKKVVYIINKCIVVFR